MKILSGRVSGLRCRWCWWVLCFLITSWLCILFRISVCAPPGVNWRLSVWMCSRSFPLWCAVVMYHELLVSAWDPLDLPYPKSVGSSTSLTLHTVGRVWGAPIYLGLIETPAAGMDSLSAFGANAPCAQSEVYDSETMGYRCSLGVSSLHSTSLVALYEVFSDGVVDLRSVSAAPTVGTAAPLGPKSGDNHPAFPTWNRSGELCRRSGAATLEDVRRAWLLCGVW